MTDIPAHQMRDNPAEDMAKRLTSHPITRLIHTRDGVEDVTCLHAAAALIRAQAAEIERLEAEADAAIQEAREEGVNEGRAEAQGATDDFWRMMQAYLLKEGVEPASDDGEGIAAHGMMDAVHELVRDVRREAARAALGGNNEDRRGLD